MSDKGFVTKGSEAYFAEREARINDHIADAKTKIEEIEARVRDEITAILIRRDTIRQHLHGFVTARNEMAERRNNAAKLIAELEAVVTICDTELPVVDAMLDELEGDYQAEDGRLSEAEKGRQRQLNKHERKKSRYELRGARLQLRKSLFLGTPSTEGDVRETA